MMGFIIVALLVMGLFMAFKMAKANKQVEDFEKSLKKNEEKKQNEITKAVEKIDSGDIDYLVSEHNSEIANRTKKD